MINKQSELALSQQKMSNPLKDQFELSIHYIDQSEAYSGTPTKYHETLGYKRGTELNSLDAVSFAVQEKVDELLKNGKLWTRFFVSKMHNQDGSTAQMMDVTNIITLIQNDKNKHILSRCYGLKTQEGKESIKGQFANRYETLKAFKDACNTLEAQYPSSEYE